MKKIVLTLVTVMFVGLTFASNVEKNVEGNANMTEAVLDMEYNYDMSLNYHMLASTLQLDNNQYDAVMFIHNKFVDEVKQAEQAKIQDRPELVKKAALKELAAMKYVLDKDQYRKYATLLNLTLSNRKLLK